MIKIKLKFNQIKKYINSDAERYFFNYSDYYFNDLCFHGY